MGQIIDLIGDDLVFKGKEGNKQQHGGLLMKESNGIF